MPELASRDHVKRMVPLMREVFERIAGGKKDRRKIALVAVAAYRFADQGPTVVVATGIVVLLSGMTLVGSVPTR